MYMYMVYLYICKCVFVFIQSICLLVGKDGNRREGCGGRVSYVL